MTSSQSGQYKYKWTHPSVLSFARGSDPIEAIEAYARKVALEAIDDGWNGPPFDPIILAEKRRIPISGNANIKDAQTISSSENALKIEFNPNRPRGRVRFSIAHEIAHTFFPDCYERTRHRDSERHERDDDWQLELLCNIAAAELIMPVGSLTNYIRDKINIDTLLDLRKKYDVSLEAILIRVAKLTDISCNMFCCSMDETGSKKGHYKIDYLIPSRTSDRIINIGTYLPTSSIVSNCTAIGFTASGDEKWPNVKEKIHVECVGLPPYPGRLYPRVAGILFSETQIIKTAQEIKYVTNDLLEQDNGEVKVIAHVVNDKTANWGGRGFARAVKDRYPGVQRSFKNWWTTAGDNFSLGNTHKYAVANNKIFVQMIAQKGYGKSPVPRIRYAALESCLIKTAQIALEYHASVHMPKIGSGYGGGAWEIIEELIIENLIKQGIEVTVYSLPKAENRDINDTFLNTLNN